MKKKAVLLAVAGLLGAGGAAAGRQPNVVLMVADDLGVGDVGCYGSEHIKTPNIDRLARQGMRFTDAHATAAVCTPSRFSIFSGRLYWQDWNGELLLRDEWTLLPEPLRDSGYTTGYFGKWHLGWGENFEGRRHRSDIDWNQTLPAGVRECGFDYFFGTPFSHNESPFVFVLNREVFGADPDDPISIIGPKEPGGAPYGKSIGGKKAHAARPEHRVDLMATHQAKQWIRENSDKPFFMNIAFVAPHVPLSSGKEFQGRSGLGAYGDFVEQLDWCVGQILDALDECGVADHTIVMFTSDNGAVAHREPIQRGHRSNLDWLGQKTDAWEGGVRVPFIVRWPGRVPPGTVSEALFSLIDISKTVWDAVGVAPENDTALDSVSQLPVWLDPDATPVRTEKMFLGIHGYALRSGDWVYIPRQGSSGVTTDFNMPGWLRLPEMGRANSDIDEAGRVKANAPDAQLYNLRNDPSQARNAIREHPETAAALAARFKQYEQMFSERSRQGGGS